MAEHRLARWRAAQQRREQTERARSICRAIEAQKMEKARRLISAEDDPEVFTTEDGPGNCPLSSAACNGFPELALRMLDWGADPKKAPYGGGTLLHAVIEPKLWGSEAALKLFGQLIAGGADPAELIVHRTRPASSPYDASLLAVILSAGARAEPYLQVLLADPGLEGIVWPTSEEYPALTASEYAWRKGDDWALGLVEGWERWGPARRAWIAAVLRAEPYTGWTDWFETGVRAGLFVSECEADDGGEK